MASLSCAKLAAIPGAMFLALVPVVLFGQVDLEYQNRGRYHEGIKPRPISSSEIELVSVLVDYREAETRLPDQLKVKFYLEEETAVHLTIRELDYRYYYWLDRVRPAKEKPWRPGFGNLFQWSTGTVLRRLDATMSLDDLGVLIRLKQEDPSWKEDVAPAILYYSAPPRRIEAYVFTLKTNGDARVACSVFEEDGATPIWTHMIRRNPGGRSFSVRWDASAAHEGRYTLMVRGYFFDTNQQFRQVVNFYHRPRAD